MKSSLKLSVLVLGLSAALLSNGALAAKTASAGVSNFGYTLIDLDLNDGVTPTIFFFNTYGNTSVNVASDNNGDSSSMSGSRNVTAWKDHQASVNLDNDSGNAKAGLTGNNFFAQGQIADSQSANFSATHSLLTNFTLSPHTRLVLTGTLSGNITSTGNGTAPWYNAANASSSVTVSNSLGNSRTQAFGQSSLLFGENGDDSYESDFALSYFNRSADATSGLLEIRNTVSAQDYGNVRNVQAVPEPETYAMLLSGLGLMGLLARRRKAR